MTDRAASPEGGAEEDDDFVGRQIALLGDRKAIGVLADTPGAVVRLFGRASDHDIRSPVAPGKWSPYDILAHLALTEWVFGLRTRTVLCDVDPVLQPVDQDRWVARAGPPVGEPAHHLQDFVHLRQANLRLWRGLTESELEQTGRHAGVDRDMSLGFLLRLLAGHDLNHLIQLEGALRAEGAD